MKDSFKALFHYLAKAATEEELRYTFMDRISPHFGVQRWGIYLNNEQNELLTCDVHGVSDAFIERYQKFGKAVDPVMKYVMEYHAPAHEELVLPKGQWKQSELYLKCCSQYNHEHIMSGAIVGNAQLVGTIHFARIADTPAFNTQDLLKLSAVCNHFSADTSCLRKHKVAVSYTSLTHLTKSLIILLISD